MAHGISVKDRLSGFLKKAFFGVSLISATGCGSALHQDLKTIPASPCMDDNALPFIFDNASRPVIFEHPGKGAFIDDDSHVMERWYGVVGRQDILMKNKTNADSLKAWMSQLDQHRNKSTGEKAREVDALVDNYLTYTPDQNLYAVNDYWATPVESVASKKGDCEDYAILKYQALRYLDVPAERIFVILTKSPETPGATGSDKGYPGDHAALAVDIRAEKNPAPVFAVLNNDRINAPMTGSDNPYVAYYAMNETGIWSIPDNSFPVWGEGKAKPVICHPGPGR